MTLVRSARSSLVTTRTRSCHDGFWSRPTARSRTWACRRPPPERLPPQLGAPSEAQPDGQLLHALTLLAPQDGGARVQRTYPHESQSSSHNLGEPPCRVFVGVKDDDLARPQTPPEDLFEHHFGQLHLGFVAAHRTRVLRTPQARGYRHPPVSIGHCTRSAPRCAARRPCASWRKSSSIRTTKAAWRTPSPPPPPCRPGTASPAYLPAEALSSRSRLP
jgi:hypothetical protein